jgi:hypothetical protein
MQKPISTKVHGFLDYMTAGLLATLPRALGWDRKVTCLMDCAAASTVVYSLMTRYELGVIKALPMKAHLTLDAVSGAAMLGAAAVLDDEDPEVRGTLAAIGAFELGAALMTRTRTEQQEAQDDAYGGVEPSARSTEFEKQIAEFNSEAPGFPERTQDKRPAEVGAVGGMHA